MPAPIRSWLKSTPEGLYCVPGDFHIDPTRPVARAIVTHGHSDHARPGHAGVLATPQTLAIMRARLGDGAGATQQELPYGQTLRLGDVTISLHPAGHVLGSAQLSILHQGSRIVISGDYKRQPDPSCAAFEPQICDLFITEATFALPIFRHPDAGSELQKLLESRKLFPDRPHLVGAYSLGKCQRVIATLRQLGFSDPIFLHGAHVAMCETYAALGVPLGELRPATTASRQELRGAIVLAPPAAVSDRWLRRLEDPVIGMASGWMRIRQRAKAGGIELPLIISDHADWDDLLRTIQDTEAAEIWVTHGAEEALIHQLQKMQIRASALNLVGYGEEE